jgi:hypothetical protein
MAVHHIDIYVGDPGSVDVGLSHLKGRVKVHPLKSYEREEPVIMVRDPGEEPVIMNLESPHEIELRIDDVDELDAKAVERIVEAADRGGHKLSIVQGEHVH